MSKIIKISEEVVSIGLDNGSIKEVRKTDLNFEPIIGDEVEVFENETDLIVTKKVKEEPVTQKSEGININVSNSNNVGQAPVYIANNTKAVNKVVYCVLAFFVGGLGIHKFYAGRIGAGIAYLLFCWTCIPSIIAFIEFIVALCKKSDASGNILV